jgi:hypothetical protein
MRLAVSAIIVCVALGFDGVHIVAQEGRKAQPRDGAAEKPAGGEIKSRPASRQQTPAHFNPRALDLLRQIAGEAKAWEDLPVAASTLARIADLLWEADAPAARAALIEAWSAAARIEEADQGRTRFRNYPKRAAARSEVLLVAKRHAPELAEEWLARMAEEAEVPKGDAQPRGAFDDRTARSNVLLQMAMQSVKQNPQGAAALAAESLRDGISFGFQQVLLALQSQDAELARQTFRLALARLQTAGMTDPNELLILYSYVYTPGTVAAANTSAERGTGQIAVGRERPTVAALAEIDPALAAEFLKTAAELLLNAPLPSATADPQTTARTQISVINYIRAKAQQAAPRQAEALAQRLSLLEVDARFAPSERAAAGDLAPVAGESREQYAERRIEELERRARRMPSGMGRDVAYAAAALATESVRYERGLSLAGKIDDDELREGVSGWLTYRAALHFIERDDYEKARELIGKGMSAEQRTASLIVGARQSVRAKNTDRARQWLQEASRVAKTRQAGGDDWAALGLGIVSAYGQFDKVAALEELPAAIKALNLARTAAAATSDKVPELRRFDGLGVPYFTHGTGGFGLQAAVEVFDGEQFEEALAALQQLKRPEVRGAAVVTLCRKHLRLPAQPQK